MHLQHCKAARSIRHSMSLYALSKRHRAKTAWSSPIMTIYKAMRAIRYTHAATLMSVWTSTYSLTTATCKNCHRWLPNHATTTTNSRKNHSHHWRHNQLAISAVASINRNPEWWHLWVAKQIRWKLRLNLSRPGTNMMLQKHQQVWPHSRTPRILAWSEVWQHRPLLLQQ